MYDADSMPNLLTLQQLRDTTEECVEELATWCVAKPRLFELPRPEQQIQFELASRLRETLRTRTANPLWDRLYFDAAEPDPAALAGGTARPPIFVDTRQLFGNVGAPTRGATEPDLALAVHVLRSTRQTLELDENGTPLQQAWLPRSLLVDGAQLEARVTQLERLAHASCDGVLLVIYANEARRRTGVDTREIASWASWQMPLDTLWWSVRHFRAKAR
jgi:hypothetical protein